MLYTIWIELLGLTEAEVKATSTISPSGDLAKALLKSEISFSSWASVTINKDGSEVGEKHSTGVLVAAFT